MILINILLAGSVSLFSAAAKPIPDVSFQHDIQPILTQNCSACHSQGGVGFERSGFSVKDYSTVMRGTKYGAVIVPGSSLDSNLVWLLKHNAQVSIDMPKKCLKLSPATDKCRIASYTPGVLPHREMVKIVKWVDEGAKDN